MLELISILEKVFAMHVPWHSESDKLQAMAAIQSAKNEIDPPVIEKLVPPAEVSQPDPTVTTADSSATDAAVSTTGVTTTAESANVTSPTTIPAPVIDANAGVNTAAVNEHAEPEYAPFPGSYTPPPA